MAFDVVVKYGEDPEGLSVYGISAKHTSGIVISTTLFPKGTSYYDPLLGNTVATEEQLDAITQAVMDLLDASPDFSEVSASKTWDPQYFQAGTPTP